MVPTHSPLCTTAPPKEGHHRSLRTPEPSPPPPEQWALSRDSPSLDSSPPTQRGPAATVQRAVGGVGAPSTSRDPTAYLQSLEAAAAATYHHVPLHFSGLKHCLFLHFCSLCVYVRALLSQSYLIQRLDHFSEESACTCDGFLVWSGGNYE